MCDSQEELMSAPGERVARWAEASPIGDLLVRSATEHPDRAALVFPEQQVTYVELLAGARRVARGLLALGVRPGEHVALLAPNGVPYVEAFFGVSMMGRWWCRLNARHRAEELGHVIDDGDVVALLTTNVDAQYSDLAGALRAGLPSLAQAPDATRPGYPRSSAAAHSGVAGRRVQRRFVPRSRFDELAEGIDPAEVDVLRARVRLRDIGAIMYTSGTTADPKGCVLTHEAMTRGPRRTGALPARRCSITPRFRCRRAVRAAVDLPHRPERAAGTGAVPVARCELVAACGMTEAAGIYAISDPDDDVELRARAQGKACPGMEIRIIDVDTGVDVGSGVIGEILVRGYSVMEGYYQDPDKTAQSIDAEGWLHTGDLYSFTVEGQVAFHGRLKDMLKVGGENVAAVEIEAFVARHPAVEWVEVVGRPDLRLDEVPVAFVELRDGHTGHRDRTAGLLHRPDRPLQGPACGVLRDRRPVAAVLPRRSTRTRCGRGSPTSKSSSQIPAAADEHPLVGQPSRLGRDARRSHRRGCVAGGGAGRAPLQPDPPRW
ncbi:hypothetical protein L7F22_000049 [Adiantum nelumboides]|nr:hypothetical protein [Adiantum nelumboides]